MLSSELAFRRQFLLSPVPCDRLETWEKTLLSSYTLYIHRDCSWVRADRETHDEHSFDSVVVAGYMIDPYQPESTTKNLARNLVRLGTTSEVSERLYTLGGRFVLFITKGEQLFLIPGSGAGMRTGCTKPFPNGNLEAIFVSRVKHPPLPNVFFIKPVRIL